MRCSRVHRRQVREHGNSLVEFALVAPMLLLTLLAIVEGGLYTTAFLSAQNAARSAALRNSGGVESATDQAQACAIALEELKGLPGVPATSSCSSAPLLVTSALCATGSACGSAPLSADGQAAVLVSVGYSLPGVFSLPFSGPVVVRATSQMRIRSYE